jgi:hypothetical protein
VKLLIPLFVLRQTALLFIHADPLFLSLSLSALCMCAVCHSLSLESGVAAVAAAAGRARWKAYFMNAEQGNARACKCIGKMPCSRHTAGVSVRVLLKFHLARSIVIFAFEKGEQGKMCCSECKERYAKCSQQKEGEIDGHTGPEKLQGSYRETLFF